MKNNHWKRCLSSSDDINREISLIIVLFKLSLGRGTINIFIKRVKLLMTSLLTSPKAQTNTQQSKSRVISVLYRGDVAKRPAAG